MLVQDNQQATASWIAGIIEGEGHFERRDYNFFRVHISNSDSDIIQKCSEFLSRNGILHQIHSEKPHKKTRKIPKKIYISSQDCINLYNQIIPYIECRRDEFQRIVGASETVRDISIDLQWLIGIWQAEGTFYLSQNHKGNYIPYASLENTNYKIIEKIVKTIHSLNLSWYVKEYIPPTKKSFKRIAFNGLRRCRRFLMATKDMWLGRRDSLRTSLMLEYIQGRLIKNQNEPYNKRDHEIYHLLKQLNV